MYSPLHNFSVLSHPAGLFPYNTVHQQIPHIFGIRHEVSAEQALWILEKPVQPFKTNFLHPFGCTLDGSGKEVKSRPDAEHNAMDASLVRSHPLFLFWCAEADPDEIGTGGIDAVNIRGILLRGQRTEGRRIQPSDFDARVTFPEVFLQLRDGLRRGAIEVMRHPAIHRGGEHGIHKIRPRHSLCLCEAKAAELMCNRRTVRERKCRVILNAAIVCPFPAHNGRMDIAEADVMSVQFLQVSSDIEHG